MNTTNFNNNDHGDTLASLYLAFEAVNANIKADNRRKEFLRKKAHVSWPAHSSTLHTATVNNKKVQNDFKQA